MRGADGVVIYAPWRRNAAIFDVLKTSWTDDEQEERMEGCGREGIQGADVWSELASQPAAASFQERSRRVCEEAITLGLGQPLANTPQRKTRPDGLMQHQTYRSV